MLATIRMLSGRRNRALTRGTPSPHTAPPLPLPHLAHAQLRIPTDVPIDVAPARRLAHGNIIRPQRHSHILRIRKLAPRRHANLPSAIHLATVDLQSIAILDQNRIAPIIRQIHVRDLRASALAHAEDPAPAPARDDFVDVDVGAVAAVGFAAVAVRHAQGGVARAGAGVGAVDQADLGVGGGLQEETAFADVAGDDGADGEAVDVPGFDGVAAGARDLGEEGWG